MFGNNNASLLQENDSVMTDASKKGPRGRGPNKFNGKSSNSKSISERLGNSKNPSLKNHLKRIKDRKGEFPGRIDKNRLNPYKSNGRPNLKDFHKSTHEKVIASNVVGKTQDLERLVKQKSKKPIKILKAERKSESVVCFTVEHMGHANALLNLSGIKFNGNTVTFAIHNRKHGITTANDYKNSISVIENLKQVIINHYDIDTQYLNLSNINNDPLLGDKKGLVDLNKSEKLGQVLCKLIKENIPQVKTISFANNNLRNLKSLSKLHAWLPNVMNLSFQNNNLVTLKDIEPLNGDKFTNLRELVIADNPIKEKELQKYGNFENLKGKIKSMFPSLLILDQEELPEGISFDVGKDLNSKSLPLQIKSSFIDSEVTASTVQDFIIKYFTLFDTNRVGLLDLYDDNALFSLSINFNIPPWRRRHEKSDNMSNWKAFDRNFKTTRQSNRDNLLIKGKNSIIQTLAKLPYTKHPLEDDSKFIIDTWQINVSPQQVLIYLNISGEFNDVEIKLNKSFSRTFLIAPSQPQSNAAKAGWAYTIFNDQVTVRPWSGNKSFDKAEKNPIQFQISNTVKSLNNNNNNATTNVFNPTIQLNTNIPNAPYNFTPEQLQEQEQFRIQHGLNEMQHKQVQELSRQTHLTYLYSLQCLNDFSWNFDSALEGYQRVKDQVPPDGYYH